MKTITRITITTHLLLTSFLPLSATTGEEISLPGNSNSTACDTQLNILLSNDDGVDKPGIIAVQQALSQAKHRVVLAAPAKNASGSSASMTFAPVAVEKVATNTYAVSASPATSVVLAVSALYPPDSPPDLVISGINKGANLGPATGISGTVGATTAAIQIIEPPIPAIAISTDPLDPNFSEEENTQHLQRISVFIVNLVGRLTQERCKNGLLLPQGLALNINYPPLPSEEIKGIVMKEQGQAPYFKISYRPSKDNADVYLPVFKTQSIENDIAQSDTLAYHQGYITIVPLDGNFTNNDTTTKNLIGPLILKLKP
ncbi:MAG: 5'/3'-nucleotidase SurE [Candidatus Reddybacter sp.]